MGVLGWGTARSYVAATEEHLQGESVSNHRGDSVCSKEIRTLFSGEW